MMPLILLSWFSACTFHAFPTFSIRSSAPAAEVCMYHVSLRTCAETQLPARKSVLSYYRVFANGVVFCPSASAPGYHKPLAVASVLRCNIVLVPQQQQDVSMKRTKMSAITARASACTQLMLPELTCALHLRSGCKADKIAVAHTASCWMFLHQNKACWWTHIHMAQSLRSSHYTCTSESEHSRPLHAC